MQNMVHAIILMAALNRQYITGLGNDANGAFITPVALTNWADIALGQVSGISYSSSHEPLLP